MSKATHISWAKAKLAVCKKLPFVSERTLEKRLDDMPLSPAEIYVLGAEEAQGELIRRINAMRPVPTTATTEGGDVK